MYPGTQTYVSSMILMERSRNPAALCIYLINLFLSAIHRGIRTDKYILWFYL
jgi:hypothetical protein